MNATRPAVTENKSNYCEQCSIDRLGEAQHSLHVSLDMVWFRRENFSSEPCLT